MSWNPVTLGELIEIKHGFAFKGAFFSDAGKYILLTPGNCHESGGLKLKGSKEKYYTGDIPEDYLLSIKDLLVVMTDLVNTAPILGGAFIIPEDDRYLHNQRLGLVIIKDKTRIHKKFLYYLLNTNTYRGQVRGSASAIVRHTSPDRIKRCEVRIPDSTKEQDRIASILSAYDDLIENNRRRIQLLEQAVRLLYKEWFVYFRFPGHEHVTITDGVPEEWEKTTIGSVSSFISRGITPKYNEEAPGIVLNQKCIRNQRVDMGLARRQSKEVTPNKLVRHGDVLINSTGQGTLGRVAQFFGSIENCTVDSHVTIARPYEDLAVQLYGHHIASMEYFLATMGRGATNQTELSKDTVSKMPFFRPPHMLAEQFEAFTKKTSGQVQNLMQQNTMLAKARDLLLPRLINGEVVV